MRHLGLQSFLCVPMRSRGQILGTLTFATAESKRRYSEIHFRAAEDLASRAAIAIENAQLLEALKGADKRKDEFLAMLAHELRNPLAPVRNAAHILRAKIAPSNETQWAMDVIERQVQQMSRLVDDLLDVSRIASGKIELRLERMAIASAVANAVEITRPLIERGRHEFSMTTPPEPLYVQADGTRLAQIFSNLITNAAKYTDPGGRIAIAIEREGDHALVRVTDTGIGIPADMLGGIFDMFVQVARAGDHSQGGLGIGLTLVKRLAEMHGGTVEAHSGGPGKGSEFRVRLPLAPERVEAVGAATGAYPVMSLEGKRILVVDDNKDAADSLAFLLRAYGTEVNVAYDGLEAVGNAVAFKPDVVLLDIGLPKLYGYDVAKRIRESRGKDVLLIAITGWGQEEDRRRAFDAGFDHHLTKPVQFEPLLRLIAKRLQGS
jgi:signal transduction histidine kinase/CheY-like chemotaxis protein